MVDQLLPPNPNKDGWYWVKQSDVGSDAWEWSSRDQKWAVGPWVITPEEAARHVILASPHPILTPEQLNALHALPAGIDRRNSRIQAVLANYQKATVDEPYARAKGRMSGFKMCAAMLRAALGAKP